MTLASRMGSKVAFVLGGANTLDGDLEKARAIAHPHTIIACNDAGADYPGFLPHFCTLHTEKAQEWYDKRKFPIGQCWTSNTKTVPDEHKSLYNHVDAWDGSSGLLCITVALHLGYEKVILCGVPLDKKANHYFDDAQWDDAPRYRRSWMKHKHLMEGKVKSFSGWTSLILGEPSSKWLAEKS